MPAPTNSFSERLPIASAHADLIQRLAAIRAPEAGYTAADHRSVADYARQMEQVWTEFGVRFGMAVEKVVEPRRLTALDYAYCGADTFDPIIHALETEADALDDYDYDQRRRTA